MRGGILLTGVLLLALGGGLACDGNPEEPKKPATPPPNPNPVPSVPQAGATQGVITPSPATRERGPDTPAVGSVAQPPTKPGGDANPKPSVPEAKGLGAGSPGTR